MSLSLALLVGCFCFRKKANEPRLDISSLQIPLDEIQIGSVNNDDNDHNEESQQVYEEIIHDIAVDNDSLPPEYDQINNEGIYDVPRTPCRHCS